MSKSIVFTPSQIKAYENGATIFIFPADLYRIESEYDEAVFPLQKSDKDVWVKEEFVIEPLNTISYQIESDRCESYTNEEWEQLKDLGIVQPASQMTKEQSRYSFKEVLDVIVVRPQELYDLYIRTDYDVPHVCDFVYAVDLLKIPKKMVGRDGESGCPIIEYQIKDFYNQQMQEQNINRTYEDNDYVFLIEIKR